MKWYYVSLDSFIPVESPVELTEEEVVRRAAATLLGILQRGEELVWVVEVEG